METRTYSVAQLAKLAGVSVKTLHYYDKIDLLKSVIKPFTSYRRYNEDHFLRLQQILFYKELDFSLKEIKLILDDPDFNLIKSLETHKKLLHLKKLRIATLLRTLNQTINNLKNKTMLKLEDLYDGLSKEEAHAYRKDAITNYGEEAVIHAENHLQALDKKDIKLLVDKQRRLGKELYLHHSESPMAENVQQLIDQHYQNTRKLWGTHNLKDKQAEAYKGLGKLYLTDDRFTSEYGAQSDEFKKFICDAMGYYADENL